MSSMSVAAPLAGAAEPIRVDTANLAQVGRALRIRWRWIVLPTVAAFVASFAFVNIVTPRYTAEAKLLLESRDSFYTRPGQDRMEQQPLIDEQAVASQVQVAMSRDLAREAVKRLALVGNPEFDPLVDGVGTLRQLMIIWGLASNPLDRPPEERVLDEYYDHLTVFPVGKSRILTVEFRSKDPDLASRAANTIAALYLEMQEAAKKDTARSASAWLGPNIETLRERVADAEAKVEAFRARTGLFAGPNNATFSGQQLSDLNTQLSQARSAQADAQAKARLIKDALKAGRAIEIPDVANNELIRRLVEQRINLRAQLALELRTLLPGHPRIKELNAQLADLDSQIRSAAERTVRTLENDARIAGGRVESLQAAVDAQKTVVAGANENEVQLRALEREARAQRDQLESYLARYREATARDADKAMPPDARIISRAIIPQFPSFPKKLPIIALTTLAAMTLAAAVAAARELLAAVPVPSAGFSAASVAPRADDALRDQASAAMPPATVAQDRLEQALGAPPAFDALHPEPRYDFAELITRLSEAGFGDRGRRILVTGVDGDAEAGGMARELGRTLARSSRTILLGLGPNGVDGGEVAQAGFTNLVAGDASFVEIIDREPGSRLHLVTAGTREASVLPVEAQIVDVALEAFDQTYDWVICVLPGAGASGLLDFFAPRVDAVIIASDDDPASDPLVELYERARNAGAPDVVVAREKAPAEVREVA
jgi:polysaccharide biosynthesis transport protein